jgi:hypothetical protein
MCSGASQLAVADKASGFALTLKEDFHCWVEASAAP